MQTIEDSQDSVSLRGELSKAKTPTHVEKGKGRGGEGGGGRESEEKGPGARRRGLQETPRPSGETMSFNDHDRRRQAPGKIHMVHRQSRMPVR